MRLAMPLKDYFAILRDFCNAPLTLNRLTLPFGMISDSTPSDSLLVGHILEDLSERIKLDQVVDCLDVLASAYDLGHENAGKFLDEAPDIIYRLVQDYGGSQIH